MPQRPRWWRAALASAAATRGTRNTAPAEALTALGLYASTAPEVKTTAEAPAAAAALTTLPALPGSCRPAHNTVSAAPPSTAVPRGTSTIPTIAATPWGVRASPARARTPRSTSTTVPAGQGRAASRSKPASMNTVSTSAPARVASSRSLGPSTTKRRSSQRAARLEASRRSRWTERWRKPAGRAEPADVPPALRSCRENPRRGGDGHSRTIEDARTRTMFGDEWPSPPLQALFSRQLLTGVAGRPAPRVPLVGRLPRRGTQHQRRERVEHHRRLVGALGVNRSLDASRLGAVHETGRVQGERADPDAGPPAAHEAPTGVEEHLVGVDVGVVVGDLHRVGVEVERPGDEAAHDEAGALEGLVDRRRLVDAAHYRLEVADRQGERPRAAVPPDDVEGVVGVAVTGPPGAGAHQHGGRSVVLGDERALGWPDVSFGKRCPFSQLAPARQVAPGHRDVAGRLDDERFNTSREHPAVGGRSGDQHVVPFGGLDGPEHRLEQRGPRLEVDHLVAGGVAVELAGAVGCHAADGDVVVAEQDLPPGDQVRSTGRLARRPDVPGPKRLVGCQGRPAHLGGLDAGDSARRMEVVEQRGSPPETLLAHQFLGEAVPLRGAVPGVPLPRNVAHLHVEAHLVVTSADRKS